MKKEFKPLQMFMFAIWMLVVSLSLVSCSQERVGDDSEDSEENEVIDTTSEIAVTGLINEYGCTYAHITSYANLNLLPMTNGELEIGVELVEANAENNSAARKSITSSLDGNQFSVRFCTLSPETGYKYRAFVKHGNLTYYGDYRTLTTKEFEYEAIDLGLSVKWATCNVDATSPVESGGYYAWGGTEDKMNTRGNSNISGTESDVAHIKWGNGWRMPTQSEISELCNKCTSKWTTVNGINGSIITGPNGNSIFLPAAGYYYNDREVSNYNSHGYYWSGTDYTGSGYCVFYLSVGYHQIESSGFESYYKYACTIRPVKEQK